MFFAFYNLIPDFFKFINEGNNKRIVGHSFIISMLTLSFIIIVNESKIVEIGVKEIEFKYIFPLLNKTFNWRDFDYFILTDEAGKYEDVEVIYLVKDKKVTKVISSFYYKNFEDLKNEIAKHLDFKGKLYINYFSQLFLRLGIRQNKLP